MTQEDYLQIESSQRQHNEVLRYDNERYYLGLQHVCKLAMILDCKITKDGDQWCCLFGEDLQEGIAGFGNTATEAVEEWGRNFGCC